MASAVHRLAALPAAASLLLALLLPLPGAAETAKPETARDLAIREMMASAGVPGLAAAVAEGREITWSGAFGVMTAGSDRPVTEATVFEAASLTKPVVAHAALQLMEAGKLDLDRPLVAYLGTDAEPDLKDDPRWPRITARHVLSHSSGLPNWRGDGPLRINFEPGSQFSYSGEGFLLLARTLEVISGQPLEALIQARVFGPLGMTSSSLIWQPAFAQNSATGHDALSEPREKDHPEKPNAAASLHTTARDYARFLAEILQPTLLKPETVTAMLTPQATVQEDLPLAWGLGWGLEGKTAPYTFWQWGHNDVFRCFTAGVRGLASPSGEATGRAFVYFTNSANGLSLAPALIELLLQDGSRQAPAVWPGYTAYDAPAFRVHRTLLLAGLEGGARAVEAQATALRKELGPEAFEEQALNNLGYTLLGKDTANARAAALAVFRLNVELYPDSWNVYDSLAEGYMKTGDREQAIHFYQESLRRNPDNENGKRMLEELGGRE